jgi:hypothetical protein
MRAQRLEVGDQGGDVERRPRGRGAAAALVVAVNQRQVLDHRRDRRQVVREARPAVRQHQWNACARRRRPQLAARDRDHLHV